MSLEKKHTIHSIQLNKSKKKLSMLTCYDFPMATLLNELPLDMILVGDSVSNVLLGHATTIPVQAKDMILFGKAVRKGAPHKFLILDAPFGSYSTFTKGVESLSMIFKETEAEAIKIEGASSFHLKLVERLCAVGIPVLGHIGLRPQSVHQQGGYKKQGKTLDSAQQLREEARLLESAGAFGLVLECVESSLAKEITETMRIPTIGIGSGLATDGQVLVTHDLLGITAGPYPSFVQPILDTRSLHKNALTSYLNS
jgi:3-methyl-2-oxobutanoate hydroxymethyltransferase